MRHAAAAAVCWLLWAGSVASAAPTSDATAQLVVRADKLLARGRTEQAINLLRRAYVRAPSVRLALQLASLLLPDPEHALSVRDAKRKAASLRERAQEIMRMVDGLPVAASPAEQTLLRDLWRRRAWAQAWTGDVSGAVASLRERGGRNDLESSRVLRGVAALAIGSDDLLAAEEALRTALRLTPEQPAVGSDLAAVLLAQGRAEESIPLWEASLRADAKDLEARRDLAAAYLSAGRPKEAWLLFEAERTACDAALNCAIEAARAALELGEPRTAIARLSGPFAGDQLEAQLLVADAHTRLGAWEHARQAYARVLEQRPGHLRARENLRAIETRMQETPGD